MAGRQVASAPDPYRVLQVQRDACPEVVAAAFGVLREMILASDAEDAPRRLAELNEPAVRRYVAQIKAGQSPWNPLEAPLPSAEEIEATAVPEQFTRPVLTAAAVLVVCVDLGVVAAMDQHLDRIGLVGGASVYPLVWNILLAARAEGFGGTITTMAVAEEPAVRELLGIPPRYAVAAVLPLGRPVQQVTRLRRRPVEDFVTRDRFDGEAF